jgi:uncharacterized protein DUF4105
MSVLIGIFAVLVVGLAIFFVALRPSNTGPWKPEYERLARADIRGDEVCLSNFRRARYTPRAAPLSLEWGERKVNLLDLKAVWFGLSVFQKPGLAHTFVSFDFGDGDPVVISVESRQRPGQRFDPIRGLLHQYHLIYVIADEKDVLGVRTYSKRNEVYFQPLTLSDERAKEIFLDMLRRLNHLVETPKFYNTLLSNCTTSLLKDTVVPKWQRFVDWRLLLPGFSDRVAYEFDILDKRFSREALRDAAYLGETDLDPLAENFSETLRHSFWRRIEDKAG